MEAKLKDEIIKAAIIWRDGWCDVEDLIEEGTGCDCETCNLIRTCNEYEDSKGK